MMLDRRTDKERLEAPVQWGHAYVKFRNDNGVPEIRIGVKEFKCIGVSPPQDHPHIYLDMATMTGSSAPTARPCSASTRVWVRVRPTRRTVCSLMN
jgi:uncharacterized Zn-finger protein